MDTYEFYLGRDNDFKTTVYRSGNPYSLGAVTKVEVRYLGKFYSSDDFPAAFDWDTGTEGEIAFYLGKIPDIQAGRDKYSELILYDGTSAPNGVVVGRLDIKGIEVE